MTPDPLVLVVDDYADAREMYCEYFELSGFRVASARNGVEALQRALALQPDVILMDLSLPAMDGLEATRRLKSDDRTRRIPVVALTGHAQASSVDEAQSAGCDAYVVKPCVPAELVSQVRRLLRTTSTATL